MFGKLGKNSLNWLKNNFNDMVRFDEPMSYHTSFKVGGPADAYVSPKNIDDLIILINWVKQNDIPFLVIGGGTNLLVKDQGIRGVVISLKGGFNHIKLTENKNDSVYLSAGAGLKLKRLCAFAIKHGILGMNFAIGIPGTFGGAVFMNAGTDRGSMSDVIKDIKVLDFLGNLVEFQRKDLVFIYRGLKSTSEIKSAIILEGTLSLKYSDTEKVKLEAKDIFHLRKQKQPIFQPSAGCFFKNPSLAFSSGALIDEAGLKGKSIGGAEISTKHANFIINKGNATASDILFLKEVVEETVFKKFNIKLFPEVQIVGE
ncbi:MAG: UDP-N-acetylmuramate dehydrogenase [Desulfobacterales bacterium]|nr:UDP-N-acetylmuramate dehydrogenase [Desulfobacterales bacterium]MBF0396053.1 UDP-N-acetylmuramate dehydrogenase [Desulfobacterales bacterium]